MDDSRLYHEGSRELQDRFDTRRIADRLERVDLHQAFTDAERAMIKSAPMFFLATILTGGIPLVSALRMVGDSIPNRVIAAHIAAVIERVKTGSGLAAAFAAGGLMPRMTLEMIEVGEATGALEEMLNQVAEFHEDELDRSLTRITTWVEPALLLVMGGLVAVVVVTMYLPIFNLAGTIK